MGEADITINIQRRVTEKVWEKESIRETSDNLSAKFLFSF